MDIRLRALEHLSIHPFALPISIKQKGICVYSIPPIFMSRLLKGFPRADIHFRPFYYQSLRLFVLVGRQCMEERLQSLDMGRYFMSAVNA